MKELAKILNTSPSKPILICGMPFSFSFEKATFIIDGETYTGYTHYLLYKGCMTVVLLLSELADKKQRVTKIIVFKELEADKFTSKNGKIVGKDMVFNYTTMFSLNKPLNGDRTSDMVETIHSYTQYSDELLKEFLIVRFKLKEDDIISGISHGGIIKMSFNKMWFVKDAYGREYAFTSKPYRNMIMKQWGPKLNRDMTYQLPKGSIKIFTGNDMKWKSEPIEL